jgi:(p)ppGpp synthase/HD superfamily hydrolase
MEFIYWCDENWEEITENIDDVAESEAGTENEFLTKKLTEKPLEQGKSGTLYDTDVIDPNSMKRINQTLNLITEKHGDQKYGKAPYITHLFGVASRMETESEIIVALLHDVLEDTPCTIQELYYLNDDECSALRVLTKNEHYNYEQTIERISQNPLATKVKIQDLKYNLESCQKPDGKKKNIEKYTKALQALTFAQSELGIK